jgi:hypothetical protein
MYAFLLWLQLQSSLGAVEGTSNRIGLHASCPAAGMQCEAAVGVPYAALRLRRPFGDVGTIEAEHLWLGSREYVRVRSSVPIVPGWTYTDELAVDRDRGRPRWREAFYLTWEKDRLLARAGVTGDLREAGVSLLVRW